MADDFTVSIELPDLPPGKAYEGWGEGQKQIALAAIGGMAHQQWLRLASDRLKERRQDFDDYWHGIGKPQLHPGFVSLALTGQRAHDLEFGRPPYDLRDVLLGPHVRVKKRGESGKGAYRNKQGMLYRPIPFRHQGPGTLGTNGAPMGSAYAPKMGAERSRELGDWVYKAAKDLGASIERPNRKVKWGERLPSGFAPKLKEHHVTDLYAGMVRTQKAYKNERTGKTTHESKYTTFRTISQSVRRGWIVPQTEGLELMQKLQLSLAQDAPAFLAQLQRGQGGGQTSPPATPAT